MDTVIIKTEQMKKQIYNPYLPNYEYIPDGEPRLFNDRLYVYGSHDRFGCRFFCDNDYALWSAPLEDLSDWKYHGIIFRRDQDPLNTENFPLFAPDCIEGKDGRYYLYYAPCGTRSIGVAVSEKPEGPFEFLSHLKDHDGDLLGMRENDPYPFDPAIFINDDGKIFFYLGFAPDPSWDFLEREFGPLPLSSGAYAVELEDDMYTLKGDVHKVEITDCPDPGHGFLEASSMRKIGSTYYFIYSSWNSHELCYATGADPSGPFTYRGILLDNGDIGLPGIVEDERMAYTGNNHGSLIRLNDQWYIFGHRQTNYGVYARQGIAEKVFIQKDGSIPQAELTSCGLNDGLLIPEGTYGAFIACHLRSKHGALHYLGNCEGEGYENIRLDHPAFSQDGEDRESDPGQYIKNMRDGAIAGFRYFAPIGKTSLKVKTRGSSGYFEVRCEYDGEILAKIPLNESGSFTESESVEILFPETDKLSLYFTYRGEGSINFLDLTFSG